MSVVGGEAPGARSARLPRASSWLDLSFRFAPRYRVVWVALAALCLLVLVGEKSVFNESSLRLVTALAGVLAIAAAGQLLVIMSGGIDLSVPAVVALAAGVVVHQTDGEPGRLGGAIALAILLTGLVGLLNGVLVALVRLNSMIVTLAMSGVVGGALVWWMGPTFSASGTVPAGLAEFTGQSVGFMSVIGLIAVAAMLALALVMRATTIGRNYVAMGTNRTAARILGIRVAGYEIAGYVIAALLYGAAGILIAGLVTTPEASIGDPYQLTTIIAVALGGAALSGGAGSVVCTLAGCLFLALLEQYLQTKGYSAGVSQIVNGVVLVFAVALVTFSPAGLGVPRLRGPFSRLARRS